MNPEKKYVAFLCPNNELDEREIWKAIPFKITIKKKRIKYLGINLTKKVKDMYTANYMKLLTEIEEDTNRKIIYAHELGELTLLKYLCYIKQPT